MSFKLKKKILYLIGGSGKIGVDIANKFLNIGFKVIVIDKIKSKKIFKNTNLVFETIDLEKLSSLEKKLKNIVKKHGIPDTLINSSYPTSKNWFNSSLDKIKINTFTKNIDIHLGSFFWSSKIIADFMKKKNRGSIIMISSIYSVVSQDPEMYKKTNLRDNQIYGVIKSGINAFVRQMSSFYGKNNIRLNTICPGGLEGEIKGFKQKQNSIFKKNYLSKLSIKRFCKPSDITEACIFLSDDKKSSYITGQNIIIDGGYTTK